MLTSFKKIHAELYFMSAGKTVNSQNTNKVFMLAEFDYIFSKKQIF